MLRIVALGDSLTYGFPFGPEDSWTSIVAARTGFEIHNKGVCGETTGEMRMRIIQDVLAYSPDIVIITGGSNDAFEGIIAREVLGNIAGIVDTAKANGVTPLIGIPPAVSFPETEAMLKGYRKDIRILSAGKVIEALDFYSVTIDATGRIKNELYVDGVHFNNKGNEVIAEVVLSALATLHQKNK